jgi:hypothetical protein
LLEVIVVTAEGVTSDGGNVVGHGRVCHAKVVADTDTLGREPLQVWVAEGIVVVGVLEPDCHEAIEDLCELSVVCKVYSISNCERTLPLTLEVG